MSLRGTQARAAPLREQGSRGRKTLVPFVVTFTAPRGRAAVITA
jgi:hypothetical protein